MFFKKISFNNFYKIKDSVGEVNKDYSNKISYAHSLIFYQMLSLSKIKWVRIDQ